jgi:hypothetical protein
MGSLMFGFFQIEKYSIIIELSLNLVSLSDNLTAIKETVKNMNILA